MIENTIALTENDLKRYKKIISLHKELLNEIGELLEENKNLRMEVGYFRRNNTPMRKKEINGIKHCPICNYPIDRHMPQHYCDGCGQALEIF